MPRLNKDILLEWGLPTEVEKEVRTYLQKHPDINLDKLVIVKGNLKEEFYSIYPDDFTYDIEDNGKILGTKEEIINKVTEAVTYSISNWSPTFEKGEEVVQYFDTEVCDIDDINATWYSTSTSEEFTGPLYDFLINIETPNQKLVDILEDRYR